VAAFWKNLAYMFAVLPHHIRSAADMQAAPADLHQNKQG
jgi:hypothetical protein